MKKIVAIIGSPNNEKSNTVTMTRDFLETVGQFYPELEYEVISLGEKSVQPCRGCQACMKTGCCIHKNDDLPEIMQKIRESDLLILGSPVYENFISGQTKILLDRTFMWIHLIGLMGKPALTAITYEEDGRWLTEKYLHAVMTMMGCIMIGHLRGRGKQPGCFPDRELCKAKYRGLAKDVAEILSGNRKLRPSIVNRICFWMMKKHHHTDFELQYWKDKGWLSMSYSKALRKEQTQSL
jgi:multimeric flavodoxin WrbA